MSSLIQRPFLAALFAVALVVVGPCHGFSSSLSESRFRKSPHLNGAKDPLLVAGSSRPRGVKQQNSRSRLRVSHLAQCSEAPSMVRLHSSSSSSSSNDDDSASEAAVEIPTDDDDDVDAPEARGGIIKILFISVPLFCKFCIVLLVKFLTDLVVYPLLVLYRLARLTKRRILRLFGMGDTSTGV